jgi:hypothetical protein
MRRAETKARQDSRKEQESVRLHPWKSECAMKTPFKLLLLLVLALPAVVQAQFTLTTNNGAIIINNYTGSGDTVTIPDTINGYPVVSIGGSAFYNCYGLTNVTIPDSVTNIGPLAFSRCYSLNEVTIGNGVTRMDYQTFAYCFDLSRVTIGNRLRGIDDSTFYCCSSLTEVAIPDSVTTIGISAFDCCTSLTGLSISKAVITIGDYAFRNCSSLTNVTLPNTLKTIGHHAFSDCYSLTNVTIPDGVTFIDNGAFEYCSSLTSLWIPHSVTGIGGSAFSGCTSLTAITMAEPNDFYSSVDGVLFNKHQTTLIQCPGGRAGSYTIPDTVTLIESEAFNRCGLTGVTIPNSVTGIGDLVFWRCNNLTNISIPDSVISIASLAIYECASLSAITVAEQNPAYSSVDGVLFNKDQTALIQCPGGRAGSYTVADRVTNICSFAFSSCASLTNVIIGSGVTSIGEYAFVSCASLTSVYFNTNPPSLGWAAFWACDHATGYYLPGTTNWGATFGDLPIEQWRPQVQARDGGFGAGLNEFGFNVKWARGMVIVVEACTNLASHTWSPLQTNTLAGDSWYFSDPNRTNYPTCLYRLRSP